MGRLSKVLLTNSVLFLVYEFTKRVTISHDSMKIADKSEIIIFPKIYKNQNNHLISN